MFGKVSSATISSLVVVCCFLIFFGIITFIFVKNNYPKNGMAILWGAIGYYLWNNCFAKIVYLIAAFANSMFTNVDGLSEVVKVAYSNIVTLIFVFLYALGFVTWTWAFYRFFVLIRYKTSMGRAVSTGFGFTLFMLLESFAATATDWINAIGYNATSYEKITEGLAEADLKKFEAFIIALIEKTPLDCFNSFFKAVVYTFFIFSLLVCIHCFSTSKKAKKLFVKMFGMTFLFFGVEILYGQKFLIHFELLGLIIQFVVAILMMLLSLRWLKQFAEDDLVVLMERFKPGVVSLIFKNHNPKEESNIKKKTASNFADFHKLNDKQ